jgi:hypothetical protein
MQLSTIAQGGIYVMIRPASRWIPFSDVVDAVLAQPIHSRIILPDELVLEIDDDDWETVRDGTRGLVAQLIKWGGAHSYYLSYTGNRSIHVHVFMDPASLRISPEGSRILASVDPGLVRSTVKAYITRQFELATGAAIDSQLTGKHLIRMEGGMNEKTNRYCTAIGSIPDARPVDYEISVPGGLPPERWNLAFLEREVNAYLSLHFKSMPEYSPSVKLKPFSTDGLADILRPVFIEGFRHYMVLSLAGWLWRHNIPMERCLETVRALNPDDKTPGRTMAVIKEVYHSRQGTRVAGYTKIIEIIRAEAMQGRITATTAETAIAGLRKIAGGAHD